MDESDTMRGKYCSFSTFEKLVMKDRGKGKKSVLPFHYPDSAVGYSPRKNLQSAPLTPRSLRLFLAGDTFKCAYVLADQEFILASTENVFNILTLLMAVHYVFDMSYPAYIPLPWVILQHWVLEDPYTEKICSNWIKLSEKRRCGGYSAIRRRHSREKLRKTDLRSFMKVAPGTRFTRRTYLPWRRNTTILDATEDWITLDAMQRATQAVALLFFLSFADAIKCSFRTVSDNNTSYTEHLFYCVSECCGDACCPAKPYIYDTKVTERLAAAFAWVFIAATIVIVLSWTNLNEHVARYLRRWKVTRETVSLTSVDNSPRSIPNYDIPSMAPNLYTQMPVLVPATTIDASKHLAPTDKTNKCLSNEDKTAPLTSPPSYPSVTGQPETENKSEPSNYHSTSSGEMVEGGNTEAEIGDRSKLLQ
ncbi:uncharacterized protein LOC135471399 isoform X2 [Liolophura sinensis]|uniref:uncharacterized protein LOC135471399 isoform X2 n=1 Tax=Liolophura sinensis TaxID=3198878 RepID=UPI0031591C80